MKESRGRIGTGVIRVAPHNGDHRVALRAAISLAVPLLVLFFLGRLDLAIYASFGGFAALYGRYDGYADRVRMQVAAGAMMIAVMLIGTAVAVAGVPIAVRVLVVAIVASLVTLIAHAGRWHPPGALFAVFATGATASLPATPASFLTVVIVGGASAAFGVALTTIIAVVRSGGWPTSARRQRLTISADAVAVAITVGAGAGLAGLAGLLLVGDHWYWAMVGAVAALGGAQLNQRVIRGVQRLAGTLIGVVIAAGLMALHLPPLGVIAVAVLLQVGAELTISRNYGIAMLFITPLALLMIELAAPVDPTTLLVDRTLDTVVGVAVGTAVALASAGIRRARSAAAAG